MNEDSPQLKAIGRLANDPRPVTFTVDRFALWCLLSGFHLACRHPNYTGQSRIIAEQVADQMAAELAGNDPELKMMWEMGKRAEFDAKAGG